MDEPILLAAGALPLRITQLDYIETIKQQQVHYKLPHDISPEYLPEHTSRGDLPLLHGPIQGLLGISWMNATYNSLYYPGSVDDYLVLDNNLFSTEFPFNLFSLTHNTNTHPSVVVCYNQHLPSVAPLQNHLVGL